MKQAELAHFRAILQAQAAEPEPRRGLFGVRSDATVQVSAAGPDSGAIPPRRLAPGRPGALFGRRPPPPETAAAAPPLLLASPIPQQEPPAALRISPRRFAAELAETPFHAEDLADPPERAGPRPGLIAGWSVNRPPSAEARLLGRIAAVIEAERHGLAARFAAAGVEAA